MIHVTILKRALLIAALFAPAIQAAAFEKNNLVQQDNKFVKVAGEAGFVKDAGLIKVGRSDSNGGFFEVYSFSQKDGFFKQDTFDQKGGFFEVYSFYEKKDFFSEDGDARLIFFSNDLAAAKFGFFRDNSPVWGDWDSRFGAFKNKKDNQNRKFSKRVWGVKAEEFSKRDCSFA